MKARYRLTSKTNATDQMVQREAYANEMRFKAQLLRQQGIDVPSFGLPNTSTRTRPARSDNISDRYFIAKDEKVRVEISELLHKYRNDSAFKVNLIHQIDDTHSLISHIYMIRISLLD